MPQNLSHFQEAMLHPDQLYDQPQDILADDSLSHHDRIKVLQNWADELKHRLESESENMPAPREPPHEEVLLENISTVLESLQHMRI